MALCRLLTAFALAFFVVSNTLATTVEISSPNDEKRAPQESQLLVRNLSTGEEVIHAVTIPGVVSINPPLEGTLYVRIKDGRYWSREILMDSQSEAISLIAHRAGTVVGNLILPSGESFSGFSLRISNDLTRFVKPSDREPTNRPTIPEGNGYCRISEARFVCVVPVGEHSLRLRASGFASHYLSRVRIREDEHTDIGDLKLVSGASIIGRLIPINGAEIPADCEISVFPEGVPSSPGMLNRINAHLHGNGFLQIIDLEAGVYSLEVRGTGIARSTLHGLVVRKGFELQLHAPITIAPTISVDGFIDPPSAPGGNQWFLELSHLDPLKHDRKYTADVDLSGSWVIYDMEPGEYILRILTRHKGDDRYHLVHRETIDVEGASPFIPLYLETIEIEGTVRLGDDPIAASLKFGDLNGLSFSADENGEFSGWLPKPGWWDVEIDADEGRIHRIARYQIDAPEKGDAATIEILLPATRLQGRVTDETGNEAPYATVSLNSRGNFRGTLTKTDAEGRYEIRGLPEGLLTAYAFDSKKHRSDEQQVHLVKNEDTELADLIIRDSIEVRGVLRSSTGVVPRAAIFPQVPGRVFSGASSTKSDLEGRFSLRVPRGTGEVLIVVEAVGRCLTGERIAVDPSGKREVEVFVTDHCGALKIDLPASGILSGEYTVLVKGDGGVLALSKLLRWASIRESGSIANLLRYYENPSTPIFVPGVEPGAYMACAVPLRGGDWMNFISTGARPASGCDAGFVTGGSTLSLSLKP